MKRKIAEAVREGSANIFADIGVADPETHLLKAQLVSRLQDVLGARGLTQVQAAEALGLSQPDISRLLNGRFREMSVERLMRLLTRLGCSIDITVKPGTARKAFAAIRLAPA